MLASRSLPYIAALAACALIGAAILAVSGYGNGPTELEAKVAAKATTAVKAKSAPAKMHLVQREMLASAAQGRLAQKDRRIFNSIALAAKKQETDGKEEEKLFMAARAKQIQLDRRLEELTRKFRAQEMALAYMRPKVAERDMDDKQLASYVNQLHAEIPVIQKDLSNVHKEVVQSKEAIKPLKDQLARTEEILTKSQNAYRLFGDREVSSTEKAELARRELEELNFASLRAEEEASAIRKELISEHDKVKAKFLNQEAKAEDAKVSMLNKQAAEMMQSAQLFDAETDEAQAYQTMFGADLGSASTEMQQQLAQLKEVEHRYEVGEYMESTGLQREKMLEAELKQAEAMQQPEDKVAKLDTAALMRGDQATVKSGEELEKLHHEAVENTDKAKSIVEKLQEDKNAWDRDAEQAYSLRVAALDHERAEQHLKLAAAAAEQEKKA